MVVRPVAPAEATAWTALRHRLWPDAKAEDLAGTVDAFFGPGTPAVVAAFLAWEGVSAVGFVELSVRSYVPGARALSAPFVEGWYVEPVARRRGVGRRLIEAAEQWARARGHDQLGSDALFDNRDGAAAHEAVGFREVEAVRCFLKDLPVRGAGDGR